MKKLIQYFIPPRKWRIPVIILLGMMVGLLVYVVRISKAHSYLSDDPSTCMNCHIMAPQYATWNHSSHREWASCNDCHVPHNNVFNKYYFKAKDGLRHATIFTMKNEPQVIYIRDEGKKVVHDNCIRCHGDLVKDAKIAAVSPGHAAHRTERVCWECHREVPHGRVNSISSVPFARVPMKTKIVPAWMKVKSD